MESYREPVDVICVCNAKGEIRPLRFRMETEDRSMSRVDICEIVSTKQIPYVGAEATVYLCRGMVDHRERLFELRYRIRTHCWELLQCLNG